MNNVALYTTVFPNALPYLSQFAASVANQRLCTFRLYAGLDRLTAADARELAGQIDVHHWEAAQENDTPGRVRSRAWRAALTDGADIVVMADSDDVLHPTRIRTAIDHINDGYDIAACALRLVDASGTPLGLELGTSKFSHQWPESLTHMNIFGLGNSAYSAAALSNSLPLADRSPIVDWQLATKAWLQGAALHLHREPLVDYRQYGRATSPILPPLRMSSFIDALELARAHYSVVRHMVLNARHSKRRLALERAIADFEAFYALTTAEKRDYLRRLEAEDVRVFHWWEYINYFPPG